MSDDDKSPIVVWPFEDAPGSLKALSDHGGDEDWLAIVPPYLTDRYIGWLEEGGPFGCCSVSRHDIADGSIVYIGAHS